MKKLTTLLISSIILIGCSITLKAQFIADMHLSKSDEEGIYQVYHDGTNYRYEFEEEGTPLVVIVHPQKNKTHILFPEKKMFQGMGTQTTRSLSNDPVQTTRYMEEAFTVKTLGKEKINGFECEKREIYSENQLLNTNWYSEKLQFPVKIKQPNQYTMELKNIKQKKPDNAMFQIPADYTLVDRNMTPMEPEPATPEKWNALEKTVPFKEICKRGDRIEVAIQETDNYKVVYTNKGDKPAKAMYEIEEGGQVLSLSKLGPADFRSKKVEPGGHKAVVLRLTPKKALVVKVLYGEMEVSVTPE
jgi:hypothetical protein